MSLKNPPSTTHSPLTPIFESFKSALDTHHDRRERIIKASRDITATSKKLIFALHRTPTPSTASFHSTIAAFYASIAPDLHGPNAHRYAVNLTGANQEYIEALCFERYITTRTLLSYEECCGVFARLGICVGGGVGIGVEDYVLGMCDFTGEVMRVGVLGAAERGVTGGDKGQGEEKGQGRLLLDDLRDVRMVLEALDVQEGSWFGGQLEKKMVVVRQSVEKVEKASYELVIRGRER
ncbi:Translin, partial [Pseudovirgaria hyperparasitica]